MKKFAKLLSVLLVVTLAVLCFAGCGETGEASDNPSANKDSYKIGVIQYISHPSLDNCYNGIAKAFEGKSNITIDRQIGSDASADADCAAYAKKMVADKCDMIFAIATPAAASAFAAVEGTDIPVVFCAVSDPVAAELVQSMDAPGYNCTGTSDVLDLNAQLDLIQEMQPDVKSIGILYTTSEANSISNLNTFKELAAKRNLTVEASGVQNASDIPAAATALAGKVDCINNFTDNNVVNNLTVVLDAAKAAGIPVYGSEVEQVKNGCLASVSIDYVALGKATGDMGLDILLNGAKASQMAVKTITDATPVINTDVLASLNMKTPDKYKNAETVKTNA